MTQSKNQVDKTFASIFLSYQVMIANQTSINITQRTFLNLDLGSDIHLSFVVNFCHNSTINTSIRDSHKIYEIRFTNHSKKLCGNTVTSIREYVGLQLEKTGHKENHNNTSHKYHFFCEALFNAWFDLSENHSLVVTDFHKFGNKVITQKNVTIIHEKYFQKSLGISINIVDTFNKRVKTSIDNQRDNMII